jgi:hypothetical protein
MAEALPLLLSLHFLEHRVRLSLVNPVRTFPGLAMAENGDPATSQRRLAAMDAGEHMPVSHWL